MVYKKIKKGLRKRYVKKNKKGKSHLRVSKLARDIAYIKSSLNSERKFIDTQLEGVLPLAAQPSLNRIETPDTQGNAVNQRQGAKVKATHFSMKGRFTHQNYGDVQANATCILYILWLKNGDNVTEFESDYANLILNPDVEGNFSPMSMFSKTKYDSWIATYKRVIKMKDLVPVNQTATGLPTNSGGANTDSTLARAPQLKYYYVNINQKISVPIEWSNVYNTSGTTGEITRYIPYIFIVSDCKGLGNSPSGTSQPDTTFNDRVTFQCQARLTYVDT